MSNGAAEQPIQEYDVNEDVEAMMKKGIEASAAKMAGKKTAGKKAAIGHKTSVLEAETMTKTMYAVSQASPEMVKLMRRKETVNQEIVDLRKVLDPQLEVVRASVREISITSLYQVMAYDKPPKMFFEWVKAICHLFRKKKPTKWKTGQTFLKEKDFQEKLIAFEPFTLSRATVDSVTACIDKPENYFEAVTETSLVDTIVGSVFSNWVGAIYRYGSQMVPKKEQLEHLEKDILHAKSDEHRLAERFVDVREKYARKLFARLDSDKSGAVDFKEIQHLLTKFHMIKEKKRVLREKIDLAHDQSKLVMDAGDKDGGYVGAAEMDYEEFTSFLLAMLRALFSELDVNKNGKLDVAEVKEFLRIVFGPGLGLGNKPPKDLKKVGKKVNAVYKKMAKIAKASADTPLPKKADVVVDCDAFIDFTLTLISSKVGIKKKSLERLLVAATKAGGISNSKKSIVEKARETTSMEDIQAAIAAETTGAQSRFGLVEVADAGATAQRDGSWEDADE